MNKSKALPAGQGCATDIQIRRRLRGLLLAGAKSAQTKPVDDAYFDSLRRKVGRPSAAR